MFRLGILLLVAAAGESSARIAVVVAEGGSVMRGHVRLAESGLVVANAAEALCRQLPLSNLVWAVFDPPSGDAERADTNVWQQADIGPSPAPGSVLRQGSRLAVRSSGLGLRGGTDAFHYVHQSAGPDAEIVAQVVSTHQTHSLALAGLMMREDLSPSARYFALALTPEGLGLTARREQTGGPVQLLTFPAGGAPCWLKIKREPGGFVAYHSRNGAQWRLVGRAALPLAPVLQAGLAVSSGVGGRLNSTTFDHARVGVALANEAFPPRAELVSGSVVVGRPVSEEGGSIGFRWGLESMSVPARSIARLQFQWAPPAWLGQLPPDQSGVWLANGDFLEAEFRAVDFSHLRVSSVLYGSRSLDPTGDVLMVTLQRARPKPAHYEVTTVHGAVWRAESLAAGDNELILQEPALGAVTVPIHHLDTIRRL